MALTGVEKRVLTALENAAGNPVRRAELSALTGYSDRQNRAAIASLINEHGIRIESSVRGGYFIPATEDGGTLAKRFIRQGFALVARGRKLLRMSGRESRLKLQTSLPFGGKR